MEESHYIKDTLHGERKLYNEEGALESVENYDMGNFSGTYILYHSNGQIKHIVN